jgi:hypothetical protein
LNMRVIRKMSMRMRMIRKIERPFCPNQTVLVINVATAPLKTPAI